MVEHNCYVTKLAGNGNRSFENTTGDILYQSCQKSDSNRRAKVILKVVGKHEIGTKVILQKSDSNSKSKGNIDSSRKARNRY